MKKIVHGQLIEMFLSSLGGWLDRKGGRITGMSGGEIVVAFEDDDWKKLYKELFDKEFEDGKNGG